MGKAFDKRGVSAEKRVAPHKPKGWNNLDMFGIGVFLRRG